MNVTQINSSCPLPHIENPLGEVVNLTERPVQTVHFVYHYCLFFNAVCVSETVYSSSR